MKNIRFFMLALMLMGAFSITKAQNPQTNNGARPLASWDILDPADTSRSQLDSASVNATMPYYIGRDPQFVGNALYDSSGFNWRYGVPVGTVDAGIEQYGGGALPTWADGSSKDTLVQFKVGDATGIDTIFVSEMSRPSADPSSGCIGGEDTTLVEVIDLPSMGASGRDTLGACGTSDDTVSYTFSGLYPLYVEYIIDAPSGPDLTDTAKIKSADGGLMIYASQLDAALGGAPTGGEEFHVQITGLWDRISWRALNRDVSSTSGGVKVDPDVSSDFRVFVYPTPSAPEIIHLKTVE